MIALGKDELELAKRISHEVWQKYDDQFGYRTEKQEANAKVSTDNPENIWFFWGQFDPHNQEEFYERLVNNSIESPGEAKLMAWTVLQIHHTRESAERLKKLGIDL